MGFWMFSTAFPNRKVCFSVFARGATHCFEQEVYEGWQQLYNHCLPRACTGFPWKDFSCLHFLRSEGGEGRGSRELQEPPTTFTVSGHSCFLLITVDVDENLGWEDLVFPKVTVLPARACLWRDALSLHLQPVPPAGPSRSTPFLTPVLERFYTAEHKLLIHHAPHYPVE